MDADTNDPDLVAGALRGDRSALAAIYDRHAPRVHDMCLHMLRDRDEAADVTAEVFLVGFSRLGQLRDPSRLRSWLFAIARHEVYRRTRRRSRTQLIEEVEQMDRLMAEQATADTDGLEAGTVDAAALVAVLRDAAAGLDDRDRMVMELQLQGVDGDEMAAALGTSVATGYQQVHRMKERLERCVGAVLVARQGREDCGALDQLLSDWDGTFSVLWRKRVARHVDGCEVCERHRRAVPATLFGGVAGALPMVPTSALGAAPASVRDRVLSGAEVGTVDGGRGWREDGFPGPDRSRRSLVVVAGVAVLVAVLLAIGGAVLALGDEDPELLAVIDASSTTSTTVDASPTTSTTSVVPAPAPPGAPTTVPVAAPSTTVPPVPTSTPPSPSPDPTPPGPTVTTSVEPGPSVELTSVPRVLYHPTPGFPTCGASTEAIASAGPTASRVELWWRDAAGADGLVDMTPSAGEWRAVVEIPDGPQGPVTLLAVAYDDRGRTGVSVTSQLPVRSCPTPG